MLLIRLLIILAVKDKSRIVVFLSHFCIAESYVLADIAVVVLSGACL
jgi:ABC-type Na+ transport system ATPase subunit NatA